ncbi:polysaccharide deacetylase family protein [Paenibacillus sp. SYP-B3998]|uniref:Polysaccharide deacetylase family protein n=1 Tax=Paenibacillus sp. SYP-B3998 TaxID=2678564 RepID=A0A6G3ZTX5_9BACL|nr:polysaccharide deacetylase family protein [Paenibacillus sp. SYP-B3998]NEW05666.1 polysaccharide deacetylase family protein [Paenibacillus sp. SYP-B3998]
MTSYRTMIMMFHSILTDTKLQSRYIQYPRQEMSARDFREIIEGLQARDYQFISLNELHTRLEQNDRELKRFPFVCFTFDDGYTNNYTHAFPIMEEYQIPFTLYLTTGYPDRDVIHISEAVEDLVRNRPNMVLTIDGDTLTYDTSTNDGKIKAIREIEQVLAQTCSTVNEMVELLQINAEQYRHYGLNWNQIGKLNESPLCTIGAHTRTHPNLTLLDMDDLRKELVEPKARIEAVIGEEVVHFSYPYGRYNENVREEAIKAGYKMITTTRGGPFIPTNFDLYALPRVCGVPDFQFEDSDSLANRGVKPSEKLQ